MQLGTNPASFGPDNTPYDALGGDACVRTLVDTFFRHLDDAPYGAARAVYPDDLAASREKLYEFLTGWLGGPPLYVSKYGHPRLRGRHIPFAIGIPERDAWLACMGVAIDACEITDELRAFLVARLSHTADFMRNQ